VAEAGHAARAHGRLRGRRPAPAPRGHLRGPQPLRGHGGGQHRPAPGRPGDRRLARRAAAGPGRAATGAGQGGVQPRHVRRRPRPRDRAVPPGRRGRRPARDARHGRHGGRGGRVHPGQPAADQPAAGRARGPPRVGGGPGGGEAVHPHLPGQLGRRPDRGGAVPPRAGGPAGGAAAGGHPVAGLPLDRAADAGTRPLPAPVRGRPGVRLLAGAGGGPAQRPAQGGPPVRGRGGPPAVRPRGRPALRRHPRPRRLPLRPGRPGRPGRPWPAGTPVECARPRCGGPAQRARIPDATSLPDRRSRRRHRPGRRPARPGPGGLARGPGRAAGRPGPPPGRDRARQPGPARGPGPACGSAARTSSCCPRWPPAWP
jgi:hypothetical protein